MGKRHGTEGKLLVRALAQTSGKTLCITADEDHFASAAVTKLAKPMCKTGGIKLLAPGLQKNHGGRAVGFELGQRRISIAHLDHFQGDIPPDAFQVLLEKGSQLWTASLPEHQ